MDFVGDFGFKLVVFEEFSELSGIESLVELSELIDNIGFGNIGVVFLDMFGDLEDFFWRDIFVSILEHLHVEVGDVSAREREMLDARAYDIPICNGDDMSDSVSAVDHSAGQLKVSLIVLILRIGLHMGAADHRQNCLHSDIQSRHVESLEKYLSHFLTILRRIHRRLCQKKHVLFRLTIHVVEN